MKIILVVVAIVLILGGGVFYAVPSVRGKISASPIFSKLLSAFPSMQRDQSENATPSAGSVMGATSKITNAAGQFANQALEIGNTALNTISSGSKDSDNVIDVGKVVSEISNRVESVPSNLLDRAKVSYCEQVLKQATNSARNN